MLLFVPVLVSCASPTAPPIEVPPAAVPAPYGIAAHEPAGAAQPPYVDVSIVSERPPRCTVLARRIPFGASSHEGELRLAFTFCVDATAESVDVSAALMKRERPQENRDVHLGRYGTGCHERELLLPFHLPRSYRYDHLRVSATAGRESGAAVCSIASVL